MNLVVLSDSLTDLALFLDAMRILYPKMDIDKLQDRINDFSDKIFETKENIDHEFLKMKISLLDSVYNYALKEIPFFHIFYKK